MAIEKKVEVDRMDITIDDGGYKHIQVRTATIVTEDGKEIARSFHRKVIHPDDDVSGETAEVQALANSLYTNDIKTAYTSFRISNTLD